MPAHVEHCLVKSLTSKSDNLPSLNPLIQHRGFRNCYRHFSSPEPEQIPLRFLAASLRSQPVMADSDTVQLWQGYVAVVLQRRRSPT